MQRARWAAAAAAAAILSALVVGTAARAEEPVAKPPKAADLGDPDKAPALDSKPTTGGVERKVGDTGMTVMLPTGWKVTKDDGSTVAITAAPGESVTLAETQDQQKADTPQLLQGVADGLRQKIPAMKLIKADLVKLNGIPAGRLRYRMTVKGHPFNMYIFVIAHGGKEYNLKLGGLAEGYKGLVPSFESVAASLHLP